MKLVLLTLILPLLAQCSSGTNSQSLPILASPARTQAWGLPKTTQTANGYRKTYTNPTNSKESFTIAGTSKLFPYFDYPPHLKTPQGDIAQKWITSLVLGQTITWYQATSASPEQNSLFRSLGLTLKNQSGMGGQYWVEAYGTKNQMQTWISELRFAN